MDRNTHYLEKYKLVHIYIRDSQDMEREIKYFRKKCGLAGIAADIRRHKYFLSRAERRKLKDKKAAQNRRRYARKKGFLNRR